MNNEISYINVIITIIFLSGFCWALIEGITDIKKHNEGTLKPTESIAEWHLQANKFLNNNPCQEFNLTTEIVNLKDKIVLCSNEKVYAPYYNKSSNNWILKRVFGVIQ